MKIVHFCLASFYIDDFGYQENIIPRIHKAQGHEVEIIASTETYSAEHRLTYVKPNSYSSKDGIRVTRLDYVRWLPKLLSRKLRLYSGLKAELERTKPDVAILHDCQFLSVFVLVEYTKKHGTIILVDSHTDSVNSARGYLSRWLLHGIVYKTCAKAIEPYTKWFLPTLPSRADFLCKVYGIRREKMRLLPFGVDDSKINWDDRGKVRQQVRQKLGIQSKQLVFISGGKIDERKNIHLLLRAFTEIHGSESVDGPVLIIFGSPVESLNEELSQYRSHRNIKLVGWQPTEEVSKLFWAADLAVFPGTHSVLWEEAIGMGLPCLFKKWSGIHHLDLEGNCKWIEDVSVSSLRQSMNELIERRDVVEQMQEIAMTKGRSTFSYQKIATEIVDLASETT